MLRPSYSELMDVLNNDTDLDSEITSRYTIVIAASKRARQIINGAPCNTSGVTTDKAVSIAVSEMNRSEIKIFPEGLPFEEEEESAEAKLERIYLSAMENNTENFSEDFAKADNGFDDDEDDDDFYDEDDDDFYDDEELDNLTESEKFEE